MAYKYDEDLEFLRTLESKELDDLVTLLTHDKDGKKRLTESLTSQELYKQHYPEHKEYAHLVLEELQTFGGNSFLNKIRSGGVLYKEILCDVCDKMKVNYNKKSSVEMIEQNLFLKILEDSVEKMTPEQLQELSKELDLPVTSFTKQAVVASLQTLIVANPFLTYKIAFMITHTIMMAILGRGLSWGATLTLSRGIGAFAGPIGWAVTGVWTAASVAGPAYRVTIPAVIQVAFLRQAQKNKSEENANQ